MLSITAEGWCHAVLSQTQYRRGDAVACLRNDITVTRQRPLCGAHDGGFDVKRSHTCVCYSFDRMLSITAVGRCHAVLSQTQYRRGDVVASLRNEHYRYAEGLAEARADERPSSRERARARANPAAAQPQGS